MLSALHRNGLGMQGSLCALCSPDHCPLLTAKDTYGNKQILCSTLDCSPCIELVAGFKTLAVSASAAWPILFQCVRHAVDLLQ